INTARSSARPRNFPRTRAKEARKPRTTESKATVIAISALVASDESHWLSEKNSWYQRNVQAGGGKASHRDEPEDRSTGKTNGQRRKAQITPPNPTKTQRNLPRWLKSSSIMSGPAWIGLLRQGEAASNRVPW